MQEIEQQATACNSQVPNRDYLMAALRCGRARLSLLRLELDEVGVLLTSSAITPQQAVDWIFNIGAMRFVSPSTVDVEIPTPSISPDATTLNNRVTS